jgi:hypothetical protein
MLLAVTGLEEVLVTTMPLKAPLLYPMQRLIRFALSSAAGEGTVMLD